MNKHQINKFFLMFIILGLLSPSLVAAQIKTERVIDICACQFTAEIGAYKYLKVTKTRFTLFNYIPKTPVMVQEIFAERKNQTYRLLALVVSSQYSSVGKFGPIIEIVKLHGPYLAGKVIYQLPIDKIYHSYAKLNWD